MYRYRLMSTGDSSRKYGNCEVCGEYATEMFHQVEERRFVDPEEPEREAYTTYRCHNLFGHEECLVNKRKE